MLSHLETASRSSWKRFLAFRSEYDIAGGNLSVCEGPAGCYPDEANLDFTIHLITKGDCWMETRTGDFRQRVQIFPGALTVTPPETRRDYELSGNFRCAALGLRFSELRELLAEIFPVKSANFSADTLSTFTDPLLEHLIWALISVASDSSPVAAGYRDNLVMTIAQTAGRRFSRRPMRPPCTVLGEMNLARIRGYIYQNIHKTISIRDLARLVRYSPYHFARSFRASLGLAPHQFILRERVRQAVEHIKNGDETVTLTEIARASGFADQSHLSRVLKKMTGRTAMEIRRGQS
jgi:AraC family transcriptional regulator